MYEENERHSFISHREYMWCVKRAEKIYSHNNKLNNEKFQLCKYDYSSLEYAEWYTESCHLKCTFDNIIGRKLTLPFINMTLFVSNIYHS